MSGVFGREQYEGEEDLDGSRGHDDIEDVQVVRVTVHRGQLFTPNPDAPETVILTPTPTQILYSQKPRVFSQDSTEASIVKRRNGEYAACCSRYEDPTTTDSVGIQTITMIQKAKITTTALLSYTDCAVDVAFAEMFHEAQGMEDDTLQLQQSLAVQDEKDDDFNSAGGRDHGRKPANTDDDRVSDAGTVYTTDEQLSDVGTAYTATTQETATNSIQSSVHSERVANTSHKARQKKITQVTDKLFADSGFKKMMLLAELLCLQFPLYPWISLYRAADIVYNPSTNYAARLRAEFMMEPEPDEGASGIEATALSRLRDKGRQGGDGVAGDETEAMGGTSSTLGVKHLWTYRTPILKGMSAVCCEFCPVDERLLVVGYAGLGLDESYGAIATWMPENPFHPMRVIYTRREITAVVWYPLGTSIVAAGFTDGSVSVYDLREDVAQMDSAGFTIPLLTSTNKNGKHTSRVWDVLWANSNAGANAGLAGDDEIEQGSGIPDYDLLISAAADGRIVERSLKRSFEYQDILTLSSVGCHPVAAKTDTKTKPDTRMTIVRKLSSALSCCFLSDGLTYLVAGDDGVIRKASRAYNEQTLMGFSGHRSSIYKVRANPSAPNIFLSASADRTVKLWQADISTSLLTLKSASDDHIYAAEWCPFRSTCMIMGTRAGAVEIWDISDTSVTPVLQLPPIIIADKNQQKEEEETTETDTDSNDDVQLTSDDVHALPVRAIACNRHVPVFAVCYESGEVYVYRLTGIEDGYMLSKIDPSGFQEVESARIETILEHHEESETAAG
ncbi:Dynein intermediate chain [Giardia muris]|uniref:Dynein axonemal intermediate chain 4 n=1 Tax=Giardia muris TaxID=5742 RepID=A0A4Z1TAT4_GIAMU|nr:Dynein intermediate chain [Giardia muris]|eukprot:TNJ29621.1 Dynein intermediate chain [Giardia muris]